MKFPAQNGRNMMKNGFQPLSSYQIYYHESELHNSHCSVLGRSILVTLLSFIYRGSRKHVFLSELFLIKTIDILTIKMKSSIEKIIIPVTPYKIKNRKEIVKKK